MKEHVIHKMIAPWDYNARKMFRKTLAWNSYFIGLKLRVLELDIYLHFAPAWYNPVIKQRKP
jgi:hypothetical protein